MDDYRTMGRPRSYSQRFSLSDHWLRGGEPLATPTSCSGIWEDNQGSTISAWGQESISLTRADRTGVGYVLPKQKLSVHRGMVLQHCFSPEGFLFVSSEMGKEARGSRRMLVCYCQDLWGELCVWVCSVGSLAGTVLSYACPHQTSPTHCCAASEFLPTATSSHTDQRAPMNHG